MMKLRIETANFSNQKETHSCEIVDNSYGLDSTVGEYLMIFMRAMLGMSFLEEQISKAIIEMAEELKIEMKTRKLDRASIVGIFEKEPPQIKDETQS